jgi:DNA-binding transcriptional LysR family regulator
VWNGEDTMPKWAEEHFPQSKIVMQVDDLYSMYCAVKAGIGIARMPCYLPDAIANSNIKRFNINLPRSTWGVWVLSHIDLRHTARVRCCREYLSEKLKQQKPLFEGDISHYFT